MCIRDRTYPGRPLSLGDSGIDVFRMQHSLNVISNEFPLIPKIAITGYFGEETENAVRIFQEVFNLPVTGIVDSETWYRIRFIYIAVANLAELISGGLTYEELQELYSGIVLQGASLPIAVSYTHLYTQAATPAVGPLAIRLCGAEPLRHVRLDHLAGSRSDRPCQTRWHGS